MVLSHSKSLWFPRAGRGEREEEGTDTYNCIILFHYHLCLGRCGGSEGVKALKAVRGQTLLCLPLKATLPTGARNICGREEDFSQLLTCEHLDSEPVRC